MKQLFLALFFLVPIICNAQEQGTITTKENHEVTSDEWIYGSGTVTLVYQYNIGTIEVESSDIKSEVYFNIEKYITGKQSFCLLKISFKGNYYHLVSIELTQTEVNDFCKALKQIQINSLIPKPDDVSRVEHHFNSPKINILKRENEWIIRFKGDEALLLASDVTSIISKLEESLAKIKELNKQ